MYVYHSKRVPASSASYQKQASETFLLTKRGFQKEQSLKRLPLVTLNHTVFLSFACDTSLENDALYIMPPVCSNLPLLRAHGTEGVARSVVYMFVLSKRKKEGDRCVLVFNWLQRGAVH